MLTIDGPANNLPRFSKKFASRCSVSATASQKMLRKLLRFLSPDPVEGGDSKPADQTPAPAPAPAPAGAPPAAAAVANGKTERELQLEKQIADEAAARKKAETDASYLADENRRLKEVPTPAKKKSSGWVFPDEEE
jgi:hypothetical protein